MLLHSSFHSFYARDMWRVRKGRQCLNDLVRRSSLIFCLNSLSAWAGYIVRPSWYSLTYRHFTPFFPMLRSLQDSTESGYAPPIQTVTRKAEELITAFDVQLKDWKASVQHSVQSEKPSSRVSKCLLPQFDGKTFQNVTEISCELLVIKTVPFIVGFVHLRHVVLCLPFVTRWVKFFTLMILHWHSHTFYLLMQNISISTTSPALWYHSIN